MLAARTEVSLTPRLDPLARRLIPKLTFAGDVRQIDPAQARRAYNLARKPYVWPIEPVGDITSAAYGHTVGASIGLGYVRRDDGQAIDAAWLAGTFEVDLAG